MVRAAKRIFVNALSAVLGGGVTVAQRVVAGMAAERPDAIFFLFCSQPDVASYPYPPNVDIHCLPELLPRQARWRWEQMKQPACIDRLEVDVILALGGYLSFRSAVPQVAVWQNSNVFSPPGIPRPLSESLLVLAQRAVQTLSMQRAAQNIFLTRNSVEMASRYWRMSDIPHHVIYSGVDIESTDRSELLPLRARDKVILSVGHTYSHKNYETMIDAMHEYRRNFDDEFRLEIIGAPANETYFARLEAQIDRLGLRDHVFFLGPRSHAEVIERMSRARLYLVTSLLETFGLTLLEAMGQGAPVVASRAACHAEIGGDAAIYCEPLDAIEFAAQIARVLHDDAFAQELQSRGFERPLDFPWSETAREYLRVLDDAH